MNPSSIRNPCFVIDSPRMNESCEEHKLLVTRTESGNLGDDSRYFKNLTGRIDTINKALEVLRSISDDENEIKKVMLALYIKGEGISKVKSQSIAYSYLSLNRHSDILPFDENLSTKKKKRFYYNASDIKINGREYIAAQGPKPEWIKMFWHTVVHKRSPLIISLENQEEKCAHYWDQSLFKEQGLQVSKRWCIHHTEGPQLLRESQDQTQQVFKTIFTAIRSEDKSSIEYQIVHMNYVGWPDRGCPSRQLFEEFLDDVESLHIPQESKITVHCSAGAGRTGVFIAAHTFFEDVLKGKVNTPEYISKKVEELRELRPGMVSHYPQLIFLKSVFIEMCKNEKRKIKEAIAEEFSRLKEVNKQFEALNIKE